MWHWVDGNSIDRVSEKKEKNFSWNCNQFQLTGVDRMIGYHLHLVSLFFCFHFVSSQFLVWVDFHSVALIFLSYTFNFHIFINITKLHLLRNDWVARKNIFRVKSWRIFVFLSISFQDVHDFSSHIFPLRPTWAIRSCEHSIISHLKATPALAFGIKR